MPLQQINIYWEISIRFVYQVADFFPEVFVNQVIQTIAQFMYSSYRKYKDFVYGKC